MSPTELQRKADKIAKRIPKLKTRGGKRRAISRMLGIHSKLNGGNHGK